MKILIAGGTGLIGSALTSLLTTAGHSVSILSRQPRASAASGAAHVHWTGAFAPALTDCVQEADAVVNLAGANIGEAKWSDARKALIRESRVRAGQALMEACAHAERKPRTFVQASAVGFYGSSYGRERLTERLPPGTDFLASVCVDWEASTAAATEMGMRRVVTRFGIVLSPQGGALPRMLLPFRLGLGGALGDGHQPFPWIHLQDAARAVAYALENDDLEGPYNVTAPSDACNRDFSRALAQALHRPMLVDMPTFAVRMLFGEMSVLLLQGQNASAQRLLDAGFAFAHSEVLPALQDLLQG